ncbi:hypothetical protein Tsp_02995 [Trichinella spiralis]|uniref:hypothetical protein n=1 Tax=Trichinella spiralis TaxID=6334 RepID=UPI0001EFB3DD|nr:hypothetical protein Tsp_02995 [Trichinella spiralis]
MWSFDSESLVLVEKSASTNAENDRLGFLDPGSITLTLIIFVAVICLVSLISLSVLMIWQYRRRHNSHQWVVNKSIPPAYQVKLSSATNRDGADGHLPQPLSHTTKQQHTIVLATAIRLAQNLWLFTRVLITIRNKEPNRETVYLFLANNSPLFQFRPPYCKLHCNEFHDNQPHSDAWCYESASHDDTLKKRGSIYLSGASLKPYAYADSLPTSNGTTRSTIFPDSAEPSPVDSRRDHSWSSNDEMIEIVARQSQAHRTPPYREKLVN